MSAKCSRCDRTSRTQFIVFYGRKYGPSCYELVLQSVSWRAALPQVKLQRCTLCQREFIAPDNIPCVTVCCSCCKSHNPGYESEPCIKNTPDGARYTNKPNLTLV